MRLAYAPVYAALLGCFFLAACTEEQGSYDLDGGDLVTVGELYVAQRGCPKCHQSTNQADGILSGNLTHIQDRDPAFIVYGSNLTPDIATGLGGWADIEIVRAMRYGVDHEQFPLCSTMPRADGDTDAGTSFMTDLEANAIVAYLRSLPAVSRAIPDSICPPLKFGPPPDMAGPDLQVDVDMAVSPVPDDLYMPVFDLGVSPDQAGDH